MLGTVVGLPVTWCCHSEDDSRKQNRLFSFVFNPKILIDQINPIIIIDCIISIFDTVKEW